MRKDWDENAPWVQMMILGYNGIRRYEEVKENYDFLAAMAKATGS